MKRYRLSLSELSAFDWWMLGLCAATVVLVLILS